MQQPAGIEPATPPSAPLWPASPQPGLALAAEFRPAGSFLVSAAEAAAPHPELVWLRPRVGLAHRVVKVLEPTERLALAPQARWGAGA